MSSINNGATPGVDPGEILSAILALVPGTSNITGGTNLVVSDGDQLDYSDVGLVRDAAGVLRITDGGVGNGRIRASSGGSTTPGFGFKDQVNTGLWIAGSGKLGLAAGGSAGVIIDEANGYEANTARGYSFAAAFGNDLDVGFYRDAAGRIKLTAGTAAGALKDLLLEQLFLVATDNTGIRLKRVGGFFDLTDGAGGAITLRVSGVSTSSDDAATSSLGHHVASDTGYLFSANLNATGAPDLSLVRDAAGILKITDGSTGAGGLRLDKTLGIHFGEEDITSVFLKITGSTGNLLVRRADDTDYAGIGVGGLNIFSDTSTPAYSFDARIDLAFKLRHSQKISWRTPDAFNAARVFEIAVTAATNRLSLFAGPNLIETAQFLRSSIFIGATRDEDIVTDSHLLGPSAYSQAVTNLTGGDLNLAGGMGRRLVTVVDYTNGALDTLTITIDGNDNVLTEDTEFIAGVSNDATATNIAAAIDALDGVSAIAIAAVVYITKDIDTKTITLATGDATAWTVTENTNGGVRINGDWGVNAAPSTTQTGYTLFTNLTTVRTLDADATSVAELADVLGTLIEDLKTKGALAA